MRSAADKVTRPEVPKEAAKLTTSSPAPTAR